jgi:membrane fusion protein, multidrug efflux system
MLRKIVSFVAAAIVLLLVVAGPLVLVKRSQFQTIGRTYAAAPQPPTTVTAAPVQNIEWERILGATGSVAAVQGVTVGAEVAGKVVKISFESGSHVKAGDLLLQLDISTEEAQLRAADATAALAQANLQRAKELRATSTNSPAELDAADAQAKQAAAQAENLRAVIAKKSIRAPFAGQLGIRLVNLGQILKEGDAIASLQTLDPIYVNFSLPQQDVSKLSPGAVVRVKTDSAQDPATAGKVTAINPDVDPVTRTVRMQATLENADEKLRPGMFASVDVVLPAKASVMAIPVTAVLYQPYGNAVFVVDEKKDEKTGQVQKVLRQQLVRLGAARGDFVEVLEGLKAGEQVVSSGVFKLRPGMVVNVDNRLAPAAKMNPNPKEA